MVENYLFRSRVTELTPHFVLMWLTGWLPWSGFLSRLVRENEAGGPLGILGRDLDKCRHAAPLEGSPV